MFDLFKIKSVKETLVVSQETKTTSEIIEEIHETFYTEADRLFKEASILNPLETDKEDLLIKKQNLESLGFIKAKDVVKGREEQNRLAEIEAENNKKNDLVEAINYFSFKYPHYKFITEDSVKKICKKYNLVYGEVSKYIGDVPEENIQQMKNFSIDEFDECYFIETKVRGFFSGSEISIGHRYKSFSEFKFFVENRDTEKSNYLDLRINGFREDFYKSPLEICAPLKDFNMESHEIKDFKISKIEIPDPVVLKPVFFKGKKHYLIVTAWGIEASDSEIANHNHN